MRMVLHINGTFTLGKYDYEVHYIIPTLSLSILVSVLVIILLLLLSQKRIGIIHRFSRLVTLLFHKWLIVRLNHKDACILTLT